MTQSGMIAGTPRPIQEVIFDIPVWLVAIINQQLAKEPEDRFQSAPCDF